jgi:hypothetical protein
MASYAAKPIRLGRGYTPVFVVVCLSPKAWRKATAKVEGNVCDFPADLDASCTHFPAQGDRGPFSLITVGPHILEEGDQAKIMGLLCHEAVHVKQRCEEIMRTTFDDETEAYLVQHITCAAWHEMRRIVGRK